MYDCKLLDEALTVAKAAQRWGGAFEKRLFAALTVADEKNTRKIRDAFPDEWNRLLTMWAVWVEQTAGEYEE